ALGSVGINVHAIAQGASARSVSCAIDAADTAVAVRTVHASFHFAQEEVNLLILGTGTVGGNLLAQIHEQAARLKKEQRIALRVVGLCNSSRSVFDAKGLDLSSGSAALDASIGPNPGKTSILELLDSLVRLPVPVLVDCTAADGMELLYEQAFQRG